MDATPMMTPPASNGRPKSRFNDLGHVRGAGNDLSLRPVESTPLGAQPLSQDFREAHSRGKAQFGRLILHQNSHGICYYEHPHQQITVVGPGGEVRGHVARVYIGNGGYKCRAQQQQP
jgi:hypothetical protein